MNTIEMLKEPDIKIALIDWLIDKDMLSNDAVLINELPVDDFSRRVDLAVANGKLLAYEIKSDFDNLNRLEGQISTYIQHFDKVTLVCSSKFTDKAIQLLPKEVEIIEFKNTKNGVKFTVKNRGKLNLISSNEHFLSFVDKRQLVKKLREQKLACSISNDRIELYESSKSLSHSKMRNISLSYLKSKYQSTHQSFVKSRDGKTQIKDLEKLSKNKLLNEAINSSTIGKRIDSLQLNSKCESSIDITENLTKMGIISNTKVTILPRVKR